MQVNVTSTNLAVSKQFKNELVKKLKTVFGRTHERIVKANITLSDVNGSKGGNDKECKIKLTLPGSPSILVMARKDTLFKAAATALSTANLTLKRKLKKQQALQRQNLYASLYGQGEPA